MTGNALPPQFPGAGLCPGCRWHRIIENRRGTRFVLCERAAWDNRLTRYPPLPVLECVGFEAQPDSPAAPG